MSSNASSPEKTPRNGTGAVSLRDVGRPALIAFSVAAGTLLLQLVQTRIYGLIFWNHLVYFIISIALLGFGISGTWLAFGDASRVVRGLTMRRAAVGFVATAVLSSFVMPRLGLSIAQVFHSASQLAQLLIRALWHTTRTWSLGTRSESSSANGTPCAGRTCSRASFIPRTNGSISTVTPGRG